MNIAAQSTNLLPVLSPARNAGGKAHGAQSGDRLEANVAERLIRVENTDQEHPCARRDHIEHEHVQRREECAPSKLSSKCIYFFPLQDK